MQNGDQNKVDSTSKGDAAESQQTLPWKMHATSSNSSSPLSAVGFILTSSDIWVHPQLPALPTVWSLTAAMATLLLDLTR